MSIRKLTDEQFANGTTIDGDRISKVMQAIQDFINGIPVRDLSNRFMQTQIVITYTPMTQAANLYMIHAATYGSPQTVMKAPFLPIYNGSSETTNESRLKGTALPFDERAAAPNWAYGTTNKTNQGAWTFSLALGRPAILYALDVTLACDQSSGGNAEWDHPLTYGSPTAYEGRTANGYTKDLQLGITIDNPFNPESMISNSQIFHRSEFSVEGSVMHPSAGTLINTYTDMNPPFSDLSGGVSKDFVNSLQYSISDLNIPLPIDSRLRTSMILPFLRGIGTTFNPWSAGNEMKWNPTIVLTLLEPVVDDK